MQGVRNNKQVISIYGRMRRLEVALMCMSITYRHWDQWKDAPAVGTRYLALIAKTRGLIAYDRIMCMEERPI